MEIPVWSERMKASTWKPTQNRQPILQHILPHGGVARGGARPGWRRLATGENAVSRS
jgi:hypothetical protein